MNKKNILFLFIIISSSAIYAQRQLLQGQLIANDDVEGIHVLNTSNSKYDISKEDGSFEILAKAKDTLYISGLKYQNQKIIITQTAVDLGRFQVQLYEDINELDEVIIGKILTGSLESDLENSDAKTDINFYDLALPGSTKKPMTINERKLYDADGGGPIYTGLGVNFHKLLNKISGRTKKLKAIVKLDEREACISRLQQEYESIIFEDIQLETAHKNEYFLFCQEDPNFMTLCKANDDLAAIEFLQSKLKVYLQNRANTNN